MKSRSYIRTIVIFIITLLSFIPAAIAALKQPYNDAAAFDMHGYVHKASIMKIDGEKNNEIEYEFSQAGKIIKLKTHEKENATDFFHKVETTTELQLNDMIKRTNGYITSFSSSALSYDKNGKLTAIQYPDEYITYKYDYNGFIIEETSRDVHNHNIIKSITTYKYTETDEQGNWLRREVLCNNIIQYKEHRKISYYIAAEQTYFDQKIYDIKGRVRNVKTQEYLDCYYYYEAKDSYTWDSFSVEGKIEDVDDYIIVRNNNNYITKIDNVTYSYNDNNEIIWCDIYIEEIGEIVSHKYEYNSDGMISKLIGIDDDIEFFTEEYIYTGPWEYDAWSGYWDQRECYDKQGNWIYRKVISTWNGESDTIYQKRTIDYWDVIELSKISQEVTDNDIPAIESNTTFTKDNSSKNKSTTKVKQNKNKKEKKTKKEKNSIEATSSHSNRDYRQENQKKATNTIGANYTNVQEPIVTTDNYELYINRIDQILPRHFVGDGRPMGIFTTRNIPQDVMETALKTSDNYKNYEVEQEKENITISIKPTNLYLRGFTNKKGTTYQSMVCHEASSTYNTKDPNRISSICFSITLPKEWNDSDVNEYTNSLKSLFQEAGIKAKDKQWSTAKGFIAHHNGNTIRVSHLMTVTTLFKPRIWIYIYYDKEL